MKKRLSRRTFLKGAGGVSISLPFLEIMGLSKAYAATPPKRLVLFFTPHGTVPYKWKPTGSGTAFEIPTGENHILEPLRNYKSDLILVNGIGTSLIDYKDGHAGQIARVLAGTKPKYGNDLGAPRSPLGPTFDQVIASNIGVGTQKRSYHLNVGGGESISWAGPDQGNPEKSSPSDVLDDLFRDVQDGPPSPAVMRAREKDISILDTVLSEYEKLKNILPSNDKQKLTAHLDSIRTIEKQIQALPSATCRKPVAVSIGENPPLDTLSELQLDLMAAGLGCDLTRVMTMQWPSYYKMNFLNGRDNTGDAEFDRRVNALVANEYNHNIAHSSYGEGNPNGGGFSGDLHNVGALVKINRWYASQLAYLIEKLKSYPEADGSTVFDHTLILWVQELSWGGHGTADPGPEPGNRYGINDRYPIPIVMAGGAGGTLRTGQYINLLDYRNKRYMNDLYVPLANAFGLPITTFGDVTFFGSAVSGLLK